MIEQSSQTYTKTIRQIMIDLLSQSPMNAKELSQALSIREKLVYDHLSHVARSVAAQGDRLQVLAFQCLECGYVFKERRRFTAAGHCPRCKKTHLEKPRYQIMRKNKE